MADHPIIQSRNGGAEHQPQQGGCRQESRFYPDHMKVKEIPLKGSRSSGSTRTAEMGWPRNRPRRRSTIVQVQAESYGIENLSPSQIRNDSVAHVFTTRPRNSTAYESIPRALSHLEGPNAKSVASILSPPESPRSELKSHFGVLSSNSSPVAMEEPISDEIKIIDPPRDHASPIYDSRPDSKYEAIEDPIFMTEWSNITQRRDSILVLRSRIHGMRGILRSKQNLKSATEDILIQRVRKRELGVVSFQDMPAGQKSILDLIEDCQNARDDYGPFEDECNNLEDQLYQDEFALDRLERQFFSRWHNMSDIQRTESDTLQMRQESSPEPTIDFPNHDADDEEFNFHPLVETYLSRKGDLEILREQFVDFEERLEFIEEEQKSRNQYHISLDPEDQAFLGNSHAARQKLLGEIRRTEEDVEELRRECFSMKLVDSDGEPTTLDGEQWQESDQWKTFEADEDIDPSSEVSEYSKYSILLPQPEMRPGSAGEIEHSHEVDLQMDEEQIAISPLGRVNSWMLNNLRCSALDVNYLARESRWMSITIGDPWQIAVLRVWFKDNFPISIPAIRTRTSSMTTQAPRQSKTLESTPTPGSHTKRPYITKRKPPCHFHRLNSDKSDATEIEDGVSIGI